MIAMRPTTRLLLVAGALALGAACTNSGLGADAATDSGTIPPATAGTGTGTGGGGGGSCAYVGTWEVSKAWCGTFEIDQDWFAVYTSTTMEISDTGNNDGSCAISFSWSGAECAEAESWEITSVAGDTWSVRFGGIDNCNPDACTFFGSDDTCVVGDRVQATPVDFTVEEVQATQLRITGLFGDETVWATSGYPQCTLDLTTEWIKQ